MSKEYSRKLENDPEFQEVMGRLAAEGVVLGETPALPWHEAVSVEAVLRAGEVVPELLAALPALIWKRPAMFTSVRGLPGGLAEAVHELKRSGQPKFAGYGAAELRSWVKKVERASKKTSYMLTFRFSEADRNLLLSLSDELGVNGTDVVRHALRVLASRLGE